MKKIGEYTARGQFLCGTSVTERIDLFDGRFDTGYRIIGFEVELAGRTNTTTLTVSCMAATETGISSETWDWGDNRQIAWAVSTADANSVSTDNKMYLDSDNLIVEDLFVGGVCTGDADALVNYQIRMEKYDITDWQGALAMVRNKSQG